MRSDQNQEVKPRLLTCSVFFKVRESSWSAPRLATWFFWTPCSSRATSEKSVSDPSTNRCRTPLWYKRLFPAGVQHYNEIKGISICEFLPPHLVIYVDSPAEEVQKKLRQSGKVRRRRGKRFCSCQAQTNNFFQPYLQNVPLEYLKSIEESYKKSFLPEIK